MSYRKIEDNAYRVEVELKKDGKRKRKSRTFGTKLKGKDLDFLIATTEQELYRELEDDDGTDLKKMKFHEFADYFLSQWGGTQRTLDSYRQLLNLRTKKYFKDYIFVDITKMDIRDYINFLRDEISPRTGKPLSPKTILHYRNLLHTLFQFAVDDLEIIDKNPVSGVKAPRQDYTPKRDFLDEDEIIKMIMALEDDGYLKYLVFFVLQIFTGARPSELYGLKWEKINFDEGIITINEALVRTSKGYIQKSTKTGDMRSMYLSPYILQKLDELWVLEAYKHGEEDMIKKYVFTNEKGEHLGHAAARNYFKNFCKRHGLRYVSPYSLRHTSASLLASKNIPAPNISMHMGHTNQITTYKYIHAMKNGTDEVQNILSEATTPKLRPRANTPHNKKAEP